MIVEILIDDPTQTVVASNVKVANTFIDRLIGLLNTQTFARGQALIIQPCKGIHMFFMKYSIDVVFYDKNNVIVGIVKEIKPGMISKNYSEAIGCIELPVNTIENLSINLGNRLKFIAS